MIENTPFAQEILKNFEENFHKQLEQSITQEYINRFSVVGMSVLLAKLLTAEEREAMMHLVQCQMIDAIEEKMSGDLGAISICAKIREALIDGMNGLETILEN